MVRAMTTTHTEGARGMDGTRADPAGKPVLVTHSGRFHCDEVFGYAVLRLALGLHQPVIQRLSGREIDAQHLARLPVTGDLKDCGPAQTTVREQQILVKAGGLLAAEIGRAHV